MTQSSNLNYWLRADLTFMDKATLATQTLSFTNRAQPLDTDNFYYPLLLSVDGIGATMGQYLPSPDSSTIVFDDSWNSLAYELKISDLLERLSIYNQTCELFFSKNSIDAGEGSSWTSIAKGLVKSWRRGSSAGAATLELTLETRPFLPKRIGQRININSPQMSAVRSSELGKFLPVVCYFADVQPIPLSYNSGNPIFGVAADFYNQFTHANCLSGIYAHFQQAPYRDEWAAITNAPSTNIAVSMHTGDTNTNLGGFGTAERAYEVDITSGVYMITGGRLKCKADQAADTSAASLIVRCYGSWTPAYGDNRPPVFLLGTATVPKQPYTFNGGANFYIDFTFDKVIIANYPRIWFSFAETGTGTNLTPYRYNAGLGVKEWTKTPSGGTTLEWSEGTGITNAPTFDVHALYFSEIAPVIGDVNEEGWIPRRVQVSQAAAGTGQNVLELRGLPIVFRVQGIIDDGSGSISGNPANTLDFSHFFTKLIAYNWNAGALAWQSDTNNWDSSTYSSTHAVFTSTHLYRRYTYGAIVDGVTVEEFLEQLCRNSAGRIGLSNSGKLGYWAWGTNIASSQRFTQENSRVLSYEQLDETFVVNSAEIIYSKFLRGFIPESAAFYYWNPGYEAVLKWYSGFSVLATNLIGQSVNLYGTHVLENILFDFVGDQTSAELLARYFLAVFNAPPQKATIQCDFADNSTLKLLDVVTIQHPALPSYYGSSPNAKPPTHSGYPIEMDQGLTYTRSQEYRAIIEARHIVFNNTESPTLELELRLLLNNPDDPT